MPSPEPTQKQRVTRLIASSLVFLAGSAVLITFVVRGYLIPAYDAWRQATPEQRSLLAASSALLLSVILVVLLLLLITAFGVRRYFHLSQSRTRTKTEHIDAWAESAKRLKTPDDEEQ